MDEMSEPLPHIRVPPTFLSQNVEAEAVPRIVEFATGERRSGPCLLSAKALKGTPPQQRDLLFQSHVKLCCRTFDFSKPGEAVQEKEAKRMLLLGLVDYVNGTQYAFKVAAFSEVLNFVAMNLFRELPRPRVRVSESDDEPTLDLAWPHLQIVYEFLLRFVVSPDVQAKVAKRFISHTFVVRLLGLFNSEDPRERDYLKTILHRIYGKFMALRAFIRKHIRQIFFESIHEGKEHFGIGELLEILGSIINGFALPLKVEHQEFLTHALLPLHKVRFVGRFHQQLSFCVVQFVEKDPLLALPILKGILRLWPRSSSSRQVLFLNELEDVLDLTQPAEFATAVPPLFRCLSHCLRAPHFQVAERTLYFWNNDYFVSLVAQNRKAVLPLMIGVLREASEGRHWNKTVASLTANVERLFADMDGPLHAATVTRWREQCDEERSVRETRDAMWAIILSSDADATPR